MLKKLLKHEWKTCSKILFPINLVIIILTLIGCLFLSTSIFENKAALPLSLFLLLLYVFSLITLGTVTLIYVYVRFYKNLFTAEGYLMFTLPATQMQLMHSKLIVGYLWLIINTALTFFSIISLGFVAGCQIADTDSLESWFFSASTSVTTMDGTVYQDLSFQEAFGYTPGVFLLLCLIMLFINCFSSLTMGYASILLGQLVEKYKLAAAIGFYIAFYLVNQIISSITMILPNIISITESAVSEADNLIFLSSFYRNLMPSSIITQLVMGIIFYLVTFLLMRRKVNLD